MDVMNGAERNALSICLKEHLQRNRLAPRAFALAAAPELDKNYPYKICNGTASQRPREDWVRVLAQELGKTPHDVRLLWLNEQPDTTDPHMEALEAEVRKFVFAHREYKVDEMAELMNLAGKLMKLREDASG